MAKVLICDKIHEKGIDQLKNAGLEVDVKLDLTPEELKKVVQDYDAVIVRSKTKITRDIIEAMPNTKVVARAGVGLDNLDVKTATEKGIKVLNSPEAVSQSTAELTLGLILSLARLLPKADQSVKGGQWLKGKLMGHQIGGKTLGIIGFGRIGFRLAKVAKALDMRILAYDIVKNEVATKELGVEWVSLDDLLKESDVISLHTTLTPQTKGMIGKRELSLVKKSAMLVNAARGGLVDEEALFEALNSGRLAGAAVDCYAVEPPTNLKLLQLPNVICTPHIGAQTEESQRDAGIIIAQKVIDALKH
ncbi:MAG: hydroxyacid dehydrogenase [Candidatus Bathyarchaeota archaeon]